MSIESLPINIWLQVFKLGNLSHHDLVNLTSLNRAVREYFLNEDYIWSSVNHRIQHKFLRDYEVSIDACYGLLPAISKQAEYANFIAFYRNYNHFLSQIANYAPDGDCNTKYYVELFGKESKYIPVLLQYINKHALKAVNFKNREEPPERIDLSRFALAQNILLVQNYRLGLQHLQQPMAQNSSLLSSFESIWFKIAHFDKAFSKLVSIRSRKLVSIQRLLHNKVYVNELLNNRNPNSYSFDSTLSSVSLEEKKGKLTFVNEFAFVTFLVRVVQLSLTQFTITSNPSHETTKRYLEGYYLEDFNILRVYANEVMGHPFVIFSILLKIIDEFVFSNFDVAIMTKEHTESKPTIVLTKNFLNINNHFVTIDTKTSTKVYNIKVFNRFQVIEKLRTTHNLTTPEKILKFLEPFSPEYLFLYYAHFAGNISSITSFLETQVHRGGDEFASLKLWYPISKIGFSKEEYNLFFFFYESKQSETELSYISTKSLAISNHLNSFGLHIDLLLALYPKTIQKLIPRELFEIDMKVVRENAIGKANSSPALAFSMPIGSFILHKRLKIYGVIVGAVAIGNEMFFKVFNQFGKIETFRSDAVQQEHNAAKIYDFLTHVPMDVFGLIFCKSFKGRLFEIIQFNSNSN